MKLTEKEQAICDEYGTPDMDHQVRCCDCPLNLHKIDPWKYTELECYATIDGRKGRSLKRYQ